MDGHDERRRFQRLDIDLTLECAAVGAEARSTCRARTRNIGSGGLYFETDSDEFSLGSLWDLALTVPPGVGHSPYAGRVRGIGEVLRVENLSGDGAKDPERRIGIAAWFSKPLTMHFRDL